MEPKQQVEQLMGRLDALKGEIAKAKHEVDKFKNQNMQVEARDASDDLARLEYRKKQVEGELAKLRKFW